MIEVKIPADIQKYKSKLFFGLSIRQVISIVGALIICVPIGVLGYGHISEDILPWVIILLVLPFAGYGFFTFKDMKFEEFMKAYINLNLFPQKRYYEDINTNLYSSLHEEIISQKIIQQRISAGEIEVDDESE